MNLVSDGNIKIFISQDNIYSILRHKKKLFRRRDFGFLLGRVEEKGERVFVNVEEIFPIGRLRDIDEFFTGTRWLGLKSKVADKYPGKEIIGWYGVRTGWDAMMMEKDQSIHQSFFNKKWHVMYLFDDRSGLGNFYTWEGSNLKRYSGEYRYGDFEGQSGHYGDKNYARWSMAIAIGAILLFLVYPRYIGPRYNSLSRGQDNGSMGDGRTVLKMNSQERENKPDKTEEDARKGQGVNLEDVHDGSENMHDKAEGIHYELENTYAQSQREIEKLKKTIDVLEHELEIKDIGAESTEQGALTNAEGIVYRVQAGDTLSGISKQFYGHSKYSKALGKLNRISDHKTLQVGSYLVIPPEQEIERVHASMEGDND